MEGATPYLVAAYAVVLGTLAGYALRLRARLAALDRALEAAPARRDPPGADAP